MPCCAERLPFNPAQSLLWSLSASRRAAESLLGAGLPGHERTLSLGEQRIISTEPGGFYAKDAPVAETARFAVLKDVRLRKFGTVTVLVLPDVEHMFAAPRIAIREFRFLPR